MFCLTMIGLLSFPLAACHQSTGKKWYDKKLFGQNIKTKFDTSNTAFIAFDEASSYLFDKNCKATVLTNNDLIIIDNLLIQCVNDYNKNLSPKFKNLSIDLAGNSYKRQIISVINNNGDKEVWLNCFCSMYDKRWKTDVLTVEDGGSCFFNLKLNLTNKTFYHLLVNGVV